MDGDEASRARLVLDGGAGPRVAGGIFGDPAGSDGPSDGDRGDGGCRADWVDGFPPDDWYSDPPDDEFWDVLDPDGEDGPPEPEWALRASARVERDLLAEAAIGAPGGWSARILERLCPDGRDHPPTDGLDAAGMLDGIAGFQRLINWAQASQQRYLAALARPGVAAPLEDAVELASCPLGIACDVPDVPMRSLLDDETWGPAIRDAATRLAAAEVGCALHLAPVTARTRTERAVTMVDHLPGTLAAQQQGDLDGYRASIIADRTSGLSPEQRRQVERRILPIAGERTPGRLREVVDREVTRIDPDAAARREQRARHGRGVRVQPGQDGMASVHADLSAPDAQISFGVLDRIARAIQAAGLGEGRGRSQIRADVFSDIFHSLAANGRISIDEPGRPANEGSRAGDPAERGGQDGTRTTIVAGSPETATIQDADGPAGNPGCPTSSDGNHQEDGEIAVTVTGPEPDGDDDAPVSAAGRIAAEAADGSGTGGRPTDVPWPHEVAAGIPASDEQDDPNPTADALTDTETSTDTAVAGAAAWQSAADRAAGPATPAGSGWVMPVCVNVYVHASTLAGWDDEPAELEGHGIVTAEFARALAESAGTVRAIAVHPPGVRQDGAPAGDPAGGPPRAEWTGTGHSTNPTRSRVCGTVLDAGRRAYRPSKAITDHVITRDRICTFAGCRARAEACDLDHRLPWDKGGATCPCNHDPLCRFHHALKTFTAWRASPGPDGGLIWTSPAGRRYATEPGHPLFDHPPDPADESAAGTTDEPADDPPPF